MSRWAHRINAFNAGELSPRIFGREDIDKYHSGAKTLLNFTIQPEGGVKKRSATRFVKPLQDSSVTARLIPFMYSTDTPYMLEFGLNYIKVFRNEAPVLETAKAITSISKANPAGIGLVAHGYVTGDEVYIDNGGDMTQVNTRYFTVTKITNDIFTLDGEDSSSHTAYTTGGTVAEVVKIVTTYTQAEVEELEFSQSSDTLYIAHEAHIPAQLTRTSHVAWSLANVAFIDGPYLTENTIDNEVDPTAVLGNVQINADAVTNINDGAGFVAALDIGRLIRIRSPENFNLGLYDYGHAIITAVNTTLQVDATVINEFASVAFGRNQWRLGAFHLTNYPAAVSFGDGRLWWGGTPLKPGAVYGSKSGDFLVYAPSTWEDDVIADDAAVAYTIGVNQVNEVKWIAGGRAIILGTPGGVFPLQASSNSEPITPTNINVPSPLEVRAAAIHPVIVGGTVIFVNRAQTELRAVIFEIKRDGFEAADLTRLADHIGDSKIQNIAYAQDPDSIIWCVRADGSMATLTYDTPEDVVAWSRQILGGSFGSGDPVVEKVAVVESPDASHDQVWLLVKRTINGSTVRYIEFLEEEFSDVADITDAFYVDCGFTYDSTATTTITGLWHLEGETVDVLADGAPIAQATVSNGSITLAVAASTVQVGYSYNADLETMPIRPSASTVVSSGTPVGAISHPAKIIARFHRTNGGKYGPDSSHLSTIVYRDPADLMDTPVPFFTGDLSLTMELDRSREPTLFFRANQPIPFNLLSITALGAGGDQ